MTTPSKPTNPHPHILHLLRLLPSTTTSTIAHLSRLLSSTSHLDTFLLTSTYTLHLLHALLARSSRTAQLRLTQSLSPLTALLDEYRMLLRLFGLLSIYNLAAKMYLAPPSSSSTTREETLMKAITWAQIVSIAAFQGLENGAYLAGRGVLGWSRERTGKAWIWSARTWMGYVGLELVKLGVEGGALRRELGGVIETGENGVEVRGEKDVMVQEEEERGVRKGKWRDWSRRLGVSAAYAPMTVHYSIENGPLSEGSIGALGVVVAWLTFGKAWRESA